MMRVASARVVKHRSNGCHLCRYGKRLWSQEVSLLRKLGSASGRADADGTGPMGRRTKVPGYESIRARDGDGFRSRIQQSAGADGIAADGVGRVYRAGCCHCAAEEAAEAGIAGGDLFRRARCRTARSVDQTRSFVSAAGKTGRGCGQTCYRVERGKILFGFGDVEEDRDAELAV